MSGVGAAVPPRASRGGIGLLVATDERELMRTELLADVTNFDIVVTTYEMAASQNMKTVLCHRSARLDTCLSAQPHLAQDRT